MGLPCCRLTIYKQFYSLYIYSANISLLSDVQTSNLSHNRDFLQPVWQRYIDFLLRAVGYNEQKVHEPIGQNLYIDYSCFSEGVVSCKHFLSVIMNTNNKIIIDCLSYSISMKLYKIGLLYTLKHLAEIAKSDENDLIFFPLSRPNY